jgi:hypothetical protein
VTLGELAPYVVRTDHDGVELELQGLPSEVGRFVCVLLGVGALMAAASVQQHIQGWLAFAAVLFVCVVVWPAWAVGGRQRLRLEPRGLVLQGHRVSTVDLLRVDIAETSLRLWRVDGTVETLELPLKDPSLLEALARILEQNVVRHGVIEPVPDSLRRLRERSPQ